MENSLNDKFFQVGEGGWSEAGRKEEVGVKQFKKWYESLIFNIYSYKFKIQVIESREDYTAANWNALTAFMILVLKRDFEKLRNVLIATSSSNGPEAIRRVRSSQLIRFILIIVRDLL